MDQPRSEPARDCHHKREIQVGDSFLLSFNVQCRGIDDELDNVSQHESPTFNCGNSYDFERLQYRYKLVGECPYIGRHLLEKVIFATTKKLSMGF